MDYFKGVMTEDEQSLYIKPPIKDVAKRLPPTRMPSFNSQLVAIKESPKETLPETSVGPMTTSIYAQPPPSSTASTSTHSGSIRKKPTISLFPDRSRHQVSPSPQPLLRITIPSTSEKHEKSDSSTKISQNSYSTPIDDGLTGLAKAKQKAMEARRKDNQSPLFDHPAQREAHNASKLMTPIQTPEPVASPPSKHRRQWSTNLRRKSKSLDNFPLPRSDMSPSPDRMWRSETVTPAASVVSFTTASEDAPTLFTKSSHRLQAAVEMKQSKHTRKSPSSSSVDILSLAENAIASDESESSRKRRARKRRSSSLSRLPIGVYPEQAAKTLPTSVKSALGSHAQSESLGYLVLLPHEVVQLNDDHLALEKQIDGIKKELNAVRQQSAELHEKMLDELRTCASAPTTDSSALNRLLHLQIDVATVEVRLDHTSRRLAKAQHRRAEVRERLLMHLAGTHAMLECDKQLAANHDTTPPETPIVSDRYKNRI